jgi:hypothetical protein
MKKPKVGDIFRWSWNAETLKKYEDKKSAGTLYWCCSRICVFEDDGKLWDTYWSSCKSENKRFTLEDAEERLELTYVGNFNDLTEAKRGDRAYYEDKYCVDISHPNMSRGGFYLRKGATKSLDKMRRIMKRNIKKLQYDADHAQRMVNEMEKELDNLSIDSYLPTTKNVALTDDSYEDSDT